MIQQFDDDSNSLPWHALGFMQTALLEEAEPHLQLAKSVDADFETRPTIVFLHGVLRDWRTFYPLLIGLQGKANLVSIDFRGHGGSQPTRTGYRVVDYVEDAVRVINCLPGNVLLYGHSLGAMVALATAVKLPERITTVVLEDPPFSTMGERLTELPLKRYFQGVERVVLHEVTHETLVQDPIGSEVSVNRLFEAFSNLVVAEGADGTVIRVRDQRDAISRRFSAECLAKVDPRILLPINTGHWMDGYNLNTLLSTKLPPVVLLRADSACGGMLTNEDTDLMTTALADRCQHIYFPGIGHTIHWAKPREIIELLIGLI